jgi:hypothetical protein
MPAKVLRCSVRAQGGTSLFDEMLTDAAEDHPDEGTFDRGSKLTFAV